MPTTIRFAANDVTLKVEEDVDEVFEAWRAAAGVPFLLQPKTRGTRVYVNPATVAYWHETPERKRSGSPAYR